MGGSSLHRLLIVMAIILAGLGISTGVGASILAVANWENDSVMFLDTDTWQRLGAASTGDGPRELALSPDRSRLYVSNFGGDLQPAGNSITVIDTSTMTEIKRISLAPYRRPNGLALTEDGRWLYVAVQADDLVLEIDLEFEAVIRVFPGGLRPYQVLLSSDETILYVSDRAGSVTAFDRESGTTIATIDSSADRGAEAMALSPDGRQLWVTQTESNWIWIIDTQTHTIEDRIRTQGNPAGMVFTDDGSTVLVTFVTGNRVSAYDVNTRQVMWSVSTGNWFSNLFSGSYPCRVTLDASGSLAYVTNSRRDTLVVIDLELRRVVRTIRTGREPRGLMVIPRLGK